MFLIEKFTALVTSRKKQDRKKEELRNDSNQHNCNLYLEYDEYYDSDMR